MLSCVQYYYSTINADPPALAPLYAEGSVVTTTDQLAAQQHKSEQYTGEAQIADWLLSLRRQFDPQSLDVQPMGPSRFMCLVTGHMYDPEDGTGWQFSHTMLFVTVGTSLMVDLEIKQCWPRACDPTDTPR